MTAYQLIVLGGGSAGLTAAAGAASMGAKVALVEKREQLGGDCLHTGCVPSKALIEAARQVHTATIAAQEYGLELRGRADFSLVKKRWQEAISHIQKHDDSERFRHMGVDVYHSYGRFVDPKRIMLDDGSVIEGKRVIIATGSRPSIPALAGLDNAAYLTNETVFDLSYIPRRLAVIGGGAVGLELGQAFSRLGSDVTVLEGNTQLLTQEDRDLVPLVKSVLEKEISFILGVKVKKIEVDQGEKVIFYHQLFQNDETEKQLRVEEILVATGRQPNVEGLHLNAAGVKTKDGHIVVNDRLQTSVRHIYAAGDVTGNHLFTHAAGEEGKIALSNALFGLRRKMKYADVPWTIFTEPEVFHLGWTEQEAKERFGEVHTYVVRGEEVDRFVTDRDGAALLKVITDAKGVIVGAHAVGKGAGEWMQEIVFAKRHGHKIGDISHVIHPYPTHAAIVQQAADQYWRRKLFAGNLSQWIEKYIRWFR